MVGSDEAVDAGVLERRAHRTLDARQDYVDAFALRRLDEYLQVVEPRGVDERHLAHADDAYDGFLLHGRAHEFVELRGYTE